MTRFLVTAMPFSGHVAPMIVIAAELVSRGHDVRFYTGSAFRESVERVGAQFVPWQAAPDFDEQNLAATFPRLVGRKGFSQLLINVQDLFIRTAPEQLQDAQAEWDREPWDVLVSDGASIGPRIIAEMIGCRWATVSVLPLYYPSRQGPPPGFRFQPGRNPLTRTRDAVLRPVLPLFSAPVDGATRRMRRDAGFPPDREPYSLQVSSPELILATGAASLDDDRTDRPERLHWIGHLRSAASTIPLPSWWEELDGRRVIHVTQGTQNIDPEDLLRPALEALADHDAIVVAVTGVKGRATLPFPVPSNVRTASLLPYDQLLPRTELVVTNGGWGGVLAFLAHGIPLVLAGADLDKPDVSRRVASTGAGLDLRTGRPSVEAVRRAVDRVLVEPEFRTHAEAVAADLAAAGGAASAAALLERFALTPARRVLGE